HMARDHSSILPRDHENIRGTHRSREIEGVIERRSALYGQQRLRLSTRAMGGAGGEDDVGGGHDAPSPLDPAPAPSGVAPRAREGSAFVGDPRSKPRSIPK